MYNIGNVYHFDDATGLLTLRVIMFPQYFTGLPEWKLWDFNDVGRSGEGYALRRFERNGVRLPQASHTAAYLEIAADCAASGKYCDELPQADVEPPVCDTGFEQVSYDRCCEITDPSNCVYAYIPPPESAAPSSSPTSVGLDIILNGDFEGYKYCPWYGTNLEFEENDFASGSRSIKTSGRTATWQGPRQKVFGRLEHGVTYDFSAWVKVLNSSAATNTFYVRLSALKSL